MKLTEKQLAELFTNSTKTGKTNYREDVAFECLGASPASSTRLSHVEEILNDHNSAQSMKMAIALKGWSHDVADSLKSSQRSWFSFLGMNSPFKTAIATVAFATAFVIAMPDFKQSEMVNMPAHQNAATDVIHNAAFDGSQYNDRLSHGGFDGPTNDKSNSDSLFNTSFG